MPLSVLDRARRRDAPPRAGRLLLHDLRRRGALAGRRQRDAPRAADRATSPSTSSAGARGCATATTTLADDASAIAVHPLRRLRLPHAGDVRRGDAARRGPARDEVVRAAGADHARRALGRLSQPVGRPHRRPTSRTSLTAYGEVLPLLAQGAVEREAPARAPCAARRSSRSSARTVELQPEAEAAGPGEVRCRP